MFIMTTQNLRTHARNYTRNTLYCLLSNKSTVQTDEPHHGGNAVYDRAGDDARYRALDREWMQVSDGAALVCKQGRVGCALVGSG